MIEFKTNEEATEAFWIYGLDYSDVGVFELHQLVLAMEREMAEQREAMTTRDIVVDPVVHADLAHDGSIRSAAITCSSHYFEGRELVRFHDDGGERRIALAGWADSRNAKPIRDAFVRWVGWLAMERLDHARSLLERIQEVA